MVIRMGNYTLYNGLELQLFEGRSEVPVQEGEQQYYICYRADLNLGIIGFEKHPFEDLFCKSTARKELNNAFFVQTYGLYKGVEVKVFAYKPAPQKAYIATEDKTAFAECLFVDMGSHLGKDIDIKELERIWEKRTPSQFNLPLPAGLELYKEIVP
jgi:hypothetical protein